MNGLLFLAAKEGAVAGIFEGVGGGERTQRPRHFLATTPELVNL